MTLRPAIATIGEMRRFDLVERSRVMGEYLGDKLTALRERHASIRDVRSLGLFWAVELVRNRTTKEQFNTSADKVNGRRLVVDGMAAHMIS